MKVSAQEIEQRQMVIEIEVEQERVQLALDQAYKRVVNRINVPGFRRGRAPRPLVERMVGREALLEEAVQQLVPQVYKDALEEQQINPAGQPSVEVTSTEPLQLKATVPLQPKVELGDYRSISVPRDSVEVEEAEIDATVESLRKRNATWAPVERDAAIGDRIGLDVKATRGDRTVIDSKDAEFVLDPDGPEPTPGFSQQLVGLEPGGQRSFTLGAAEGTEGEAAEPTDFSVTLHWVKEEQLPEVDDEFARTAGEKQTVEELRQEIRDKIGRQKELQAQERHREAAVEAAVEQATVVAPPQTVEREAQRLLDTMAARLDNQGISIEQYLQFTDKNEESFKAELLAEADRTLKRTLVLEAIADAEGIDVTEDQVRQEIEKASQSSNDPARTARDALARPETRSRIESFLKTSSALQRLVELGGGTPQESGSDAEVSETPGETNVESS